MEEIDICAGGVWHAPSLAAGLRALGYSVRVISTSPGIGGSSECVRVRGLWEVQRGCGRLGLDASWVNGAVGRALASRLRPGVRTIAWSSFARAAIERGHPTVVVRGSHHIAEQREILLGAERETVLRVPKPSVAAVEREQWEYRRAQMISVPSQVAARSHYWREDDARVRVHPLGFPRVNGLRNETRGRSGRVVFVGAVGVRKGVDVLATALPNAKLGIAGVDIVGRREVGFGRVALPSWWTLHGQQPWWKVIDVVRHASVMLLLSREEGQARAGMEALALGTPVVVSEATGLGDFVADGGGRVVPDVGDVAAVERAYEDVMRNWQAHSDRAIEVARGWTWIDHAAALVKDVEWN